jgi:hypothetical protein
MDHFSNGRVRVPYPHQAIVALEDTYSLSFPAVECPCPPWFSPDTAVQGNLTDWRGTPYTSEPLCIDPKDVSGRGYMDKASYACPPGYVFDTFGTPGLDKDLDVIELTCGKWAGWEPPIELKCIRKLFLVLH